MEYLMSRYPIIIIACLVLISCNRSESETLKPFAPANNDQKDELVSEIPHDVYSTKSGRAEFYGDAIGTIGIFIGQSGSMNGDIDLQESTMEFSVNLKSLSTGIDRRDRDMFVALKADQYPEIRFTGSFEPAFNPYSTGKQAVTAKGEFHLHGVTNLLVVNGFLKRQGDAIVMEADWNIDVTDYGIDPPTVLFVSIANEVDINVSARLLPITTDLTSAGPADYPATGHRSENFAFQLR